VVIIGAGPAGSTAGYILALNGLDVLIVDKSTFPRDKLCGGLLTLKTVKLLESVFNLSVDRMKGHRLIACQSFNYRVVSSKGESIEGRMDYPFYFVQRSIYDAFWLERAQKAGARFRGGEKIVALDIPAKKVTTDKGSEFFGNFILGADGALSKTKKLLSAAGRIQPNRRSEMAVTLETFVPNRDISDPAAYPSIHFGHIRWGYAWSFPGENFRILGVAGLKNKAGQSPKTAFHRFLESLNIPLRRVPHLKSHALPYGNYLCPPGCGNVLLLGDACGLADPLLGEGIYYAHQSSRLAAQSILNAAGNAQAAFDRYTRLLEQELIADLRFLRALRQIMFSLPGNWPFKILSALLRLMPGQCEKGVHGMRSVKQFRRGSFYSSWFHS